MDYILSDLFLEGPLARWSDPESSITEVPEVPLAVAASHSGHSDLVAAGRDIFFGKGNCAQCHGSTAMGDGETANYDDWTKDWSNTAGVDRTRKSTYRDFIAAGALTCRPILPRNLRLPVYRGGGRPQDLFLRIRNGIEGTPMPSNAILTDEEVWALVAYVKWLPFEKAGQQKPKLINNEAVIR